MAHGFGAAVRGRYERGNARSRASRRSARSCTCFFSSGRRRKTADALSQSRLSMAGYPEINVPASTEFGIPVCAVARLPHRSSRCPATPTCPASDDVVLEGRAAGDTDLRREEDVRPTVTPCAI